MTKNEQNMSKIVFSDRIILIDVLAILFGISSWVEINGVWVQTPILVNKLPESWTLASYIGLNLFNLLIIINRLLINCLLIVY
jgi:riboflavin transporter 2